MEPEATRELLEEYTDGNATRDHVALFQTMHRAAPQVGAATLSMLSAEIWKFFKVQERTEEMLCVGGPLHGQRHAVPVDADEVVFDRSGVRYLRDMVIGPLASFDVLVYAGDVA